MIKTKVYLHSNKDSMYSKGQDIGLTSEALDNFKYALYKVEIELEVEKKTGEYHIITIDGQPIIQMNNIKIIP